MTFRRKRRKKRSHLLRIPVSTPQARLSRNAGVAVCYMAAIIVLHGFAMMQFEGMPFADGLWLTMTTITTVGYGDLSASSWPGRLTTVLLIYLGGIFIVGKFVGDFFDYRLSRRTAIKTGKWDFSDMEDHIIVIGTEYDYENYFTRLIEEFRREEATQDREIVLLSSSFKDGLPLPLENLMVNYVQGAGGDPDALQRAGIGRAKIVAVLAWNENERRSDGKTFDIIHRIREINADAQIIAECVDDTNRIRLIEAGASVVIRPIRSYPEMTVGALLNPGSSEILENLFTGEGEKIVCVSDKQEEVWQDVVIRYVSNGEGIPIAYRAKKSGKIVTVPAPDQLIAADQIFVLTRESLTGAAS